MKRFVTITSLLIVFISWPSTKTQAQIGIITGLAKRVIKAIDLQVQRLQNNTVTLQNAQQALQNTLSKLKLNEITDWATKQKTLFKTFYDELWQVKNAIALYNRGKEIVQKQIDLVNEYKQAYALFRQDTHFSADELTYMGNVYSGILDESIKNLEQITMVLNAFTVQMDDAKRLEIMETAGNKIDQNMVDLKRFNNSNVIVSLQRAKDITELQQVESYYGISK